MNIPRRSTFGSRKRRLHVRFGFFICPLTGYEPKLAMSMSTLRRRRSEASKREEEGTLEIGVADRRLDALIEEEVRRTRSADAGPRRSTAEASTPQGRPKALRPSPSQEPRDRTAAAGGEPTDPSSLKSMKPVDPARPLSVDPGLIFLVGAWGHFMMRFNKLTMYYGKH